MSGNSAVVWTKYNLSEICIAEFKISLMGR